MKKDKLEQFVIDNAEGFDNLEPPIMAWDTIESQLPGTRPKPFRKLWFYAWKAAAAILIFASAWILNDYVEYRKTAGNNDSASGIVSSPELNELSDAEAYYTSQISSKQAELASYAKQHPEIIEDLKKEFLELDRNRAELKNDLAESNADEKVIEAIILSYRVKIEILDQMLAEFHKTKNDNVPHKHVETSL